MWSSKFVYKRVIKKISTNLPCTIETFKKAQFLRQVSRLSNEQFRIPCRRIACCRTEGKTFVKTLERGILLFFNLPIYNICLSLSVDRLLSPLRYRAYKSQETLNLPRVMLSDTHGQSSLNFAQITFQPITRRQSNTRLWQHN